MVTVSASPVNAPTKVVEVIDEAPVMTPPSILIVPSNKMAEPSAGSMLMAAPESRVNTPAESISTVPSAVICMLAAAAAVSVVIILRVPFVPTVNTAVSLALPVMVITFPLIRTSSTVRVVSVPTLVSEEPTTVEPKAVSESTFEVSIKYENPSASSIPPSSVVAMSAASTEKRYSPKSAVAEPVGVSKATYSRTTVPEAKVGVMVRRSVAEEPYENTGFPLFTLS